MRELDASGGSLPARAMPIPDRYTLDTVGVVLLRVDNMDIALPGRGLGLGLGGPSVPDDIDCSEAE